MSVKEELGKAVPAFVKNTPEWVTFLRWISQRKIASSTQLKFELRESIKECQDILNKGMIGREGTNTRLVRQIAKRLDFLKLVRDKIVKYL